VSVRGEETILFRFRPREFAVTFCRFVDVDFVADGAASKLLRLWARKASANGARNFGKARLFAR